VTGYELTLTQTQPLWCAVQVVGGPLRGEAAEILLPWSTDAVTRPFDQIVTAKSTQRTTMRNTMRSTQALNDSGALWSFLNWRTLTTYQKASLNARWKIESLLVWDKGCPGTGTRKGLRPSYEMVSLFCRENFAIADRRIKDIRQNQWGSAEPNGHPAEKPEELISWLIKISLPESGVLPTGLWGPARQVRWKYFPSEADRKAGRHTARRGSWPIVTESRPFSSRTEPNGDHQ
jgi:DNA modification methylase